MIFCNGCRQYIESHDTHVRVCPAVQQLNRERDSQTNDWSQTDEIKTLRARLDSTQRVAFQAQEMAKEIAAKLAAAEEVIASARAVSLWFSKDSPCRTILEEKIAAYDALQGKDNP